MSSTMDEKIAALEERKKNKIIKIECKKNSINSLKERIANEETQIASINEDIVGIQAKIDALKEKKRVSELKIIEKRKDEFITLMLDAIVVGANGLKVKHGQIAPYCYGYEVREPQEKGFVKIVSCDEGCWYKQLPEKLYRYYLNTRKWTLDDFEAFKRVVNECWDNLPTTYNEDLYNPPKNSWQRNHIADGYEIDGFANIVANKCGGTYSSCTTSTQNSLARELIVLKGYCVDYALKEKARRDNFSSIFKDNSFWAMASMMFARHGIDKNLTNGTEWAKRNPDRAYRKSQKTA